MDGRNLGKIPQRAGHKPKLRIVKFKVGINSERLLKFEKYDRPDFHSHEKIQKLHPVC